MVEKLIERSLEKTEISPVKQPYVNIDEHEFDEILKNLS